MMNVFLDTNILLEVVLCRKKKAVCQQILQAGMDGEVSLFASYLSFANMAYILQRNKVPREQIYQVERMLESRMEVLPMDKEPVASCPAPRGEGLRGHAPVSECADWRMRLHRDYQH